MVELVTVMPGYAVITVQKEKPKFFIKIDDIFVKNYLITTKFILFYLKKNERLFFPANF